METILPTGKKTSRLGFGGAVLFGGADTQKSLRLLSAAYDTGFRHFDVAPGYGLGLAEDVLGQFLRNHRNEVTVTTKVGIARPKNQYFLSTVRRLVRPILSATPAMRQWLAHKAYRTTRHIVTNVAELRTSLHESLRRLGIEQVDTLLLHEFAKRTITEEVIKFLEDAKKAGQIGCYGIGSRQEEAVSIARQLPEVATIVQTDWCVLDGPLDIPANAFVITHGALRQITTVWDWLQHEPGRIARFSEACNADLRSKDTLSDLLLAAAMSRSERGMVLTASSKLERILRISELMKNRDLVDAGHAFAKLIEEEQRERERCGD